jgi:3-hydroxymyristoyl/3-hydroxydecanoyl-(acyl carrier protein) dehydratase
VLLETRVEPPSYARLALLVPSDLRCLRGHFPGLPIVPGAIQLGWVLAFASELLGSRPVLRGLQSVKFQRLVLPGQTLSLTIRLDQEREIIQFEFVSAAGRHSSGRVLLGAVSV